MKFTETELFLDYPAISKKNKNRFGMFKANNSGLHESNISVKPEIFTEEYF